MRLHRIQLLVLGGLEEADDGARLFDRGAFAGALLRCHFHLVRRQSDRAGTGVCGSPHTPLVSSAHADADNRSAGARAPAP